MGHDEHNSLGCHHGPVKKVLLSSLGRWENGGLPRIKNMAKVMQLSSDTVPCLSYCSLSVWLQNLSCHTVFPGENTGQIICLQIIGNEQWIYVFNFNPHGRWYTVLTMCQLRSQVLPTWDSVNDYNVPQTRLLWLPLFYGREGESQSSWVTSRSHSRWPVDLNPHNSNNKLCLSALSDDLSLFILEGRE